MEPYEKVCLCCNIIKQSRVNNAFYMRNGVTKVTCKACDNNPAIGWLTGNRKRNKFLKLKAAINIIPKLECSTCNESYIKSTKFFPKLNKISKYNINIPHWEYNKCVKCFREEAEYEHYQRINNYKERLKQEKENAIKEETRRKLLTPDELFTDDIRLIKKDLRYTEDGLRYPNSKIPYKERDIYIVNLLSNQGIVPTPELIELKRKQLKMIRYVRKEEKKGISS